VDGLLKDPMNYQGVDPALVGRRHRFVLGKHSGRRALHQAYDELGIALEGREPALLLERVRGFVMRAKRAPTGRDLETMYRELCEEACTTGHA
jgi:homocitrate synthase NifV